MALWANPLESGLGIAQSILLLFFLLKINPIFCAAELMFGLFLAWIGFGLVWFSLDGGEGANTNFFLCLYSNLVNFRLYNENWLCTMSGSALKVCVGGGWVVVV